MKEATRDANRANRWHDPDLLDAQSKVRLSRKTRPAVSARSLAWFTSTDRGVNTDVEQL